MTINLATPFPPIGSVVTWRQSKDDEVITVRARALHWRPSGDMRVYAFEINGVEIKGVVSFDTDLNRLQVVPSDWNGSVPLTIETVRRGAP